MSEDLKLEQQIDVALAADEPAPASSDQQPGLGGPDNADEVGPGPAGVGGSAISAGDDAKVDADTTGGSTEE